MLSLNQVRPQMVVLFNNQPHLVLSAVHSQLGRGHARLNIKWRNLVNGNVGETTFQGEEKFEEAPVHYKQAQFLYNDRSKSVVMLNDTFEQIELEIEPNQLMYLTEGTQLDLIYFRDEVIGVRLPKKVALLVESAPEAVKGNTANSPTKAITLETGLVIQAPLFIKKGDRVVVNTQTNSYDSRA